MVGANWTTKRGNGTGTPLRKPATNTSDGFVAGPSVPMTRDRMSTHTRDGTAVHRVADVSIHFCRLYVDSSTVLKSAGRITSSSSTSSE